MAVQKSKKNSLGDFYAIRTGNWKWIGPILQLL